MPLAKEWDRIFGLQENPFVEADDKPAPLREDVDPPGLQTVLANVFKAWGDSGKLEQTP